jgi:hypothetical protein
VTAGDEDAELDDPLTQERRRAAVVSFLGAGLSSPLPTSVMVSALAAARRELQAHLARRAPVNSWLESEVRLRGVRENAAVLAVLELPEQRAEIAEAYRRDHPDRVGALDELMVVLAHSS